MTYREQLDLLLAGLHHLRMDAGERWVDLQALAKALAWDSPVDVLDAARFLENQGYIRADFRLGGAVAAELTPAGTMFLQDRGAEAERLTREAGDRLSAFCANQPEVHFSAAESVKEQPESQRRLALERVDRLVEALQRVGPPELVQDHLSDLQILRLELLKREPDRQVIDAKVHALSILALPLGPEARELVELLSV